MRDEEGMAMIERFGTEEHIMECISKQLNKKEELKEEEEEEVSIEDDRQYKMEYMMGLAEEMEGDIEELKTNIKDNLHEIIDNLKEKNCPKDIVSKEGVYEAMVKFDAAMLYIEAIIKDIKDAEY